MASDSHSARLSVAVTLWPALTRAAHMGAPIRPRPTKAISRTCSHYPAEQPETTEPGMAAFWPGRRDLGPVRSSGGTVHGRMPAAPCSGTDLSCAGCRVGTSRAACPGAQRGEHELPGCPRLTAGHVRAHNYDAVGVDQLLLVIGRGAAAELAPDRDGGAVSK